MAPKLYVSPAFEEPVPAVYVTFALASDSVKLTPGGVVLDVPVLASASKFSVRTWVEVIDAVPSAVTVRRCHRDENGESGGDKGGERSARAEPGAQHPPEGTQPGGSPRPPICTLRVGALTGWFPVEAQQGQAGRTSFVPAAMTYVACCATVLAASLASSTRRSSARHSVPLTVCRK